MKKHTIKDCPLFEGLKDSEIEYGKEYFNAKEKNFDKGSFLKRAGESLSYFGFVVSGNAQVFIYDAAGNKIIMTALGPGSTFGQSMCFLGNKNDVYISAISDLTIIALSVDRIKNPNLNKSAIDNKLFNAFIADLAKRTLFMNQRIQVLSQITTREKILTFLSSYTKNPDGSITIGMNREDMASYLGVNRSALSRELSQMKASGLIDYEKNIFKIL